MKRWIVWNETSEKYIWYGSDADAAKWRRLGLRVVEAD